MPAVARSALWRGYHALALKGRRRMKQSESYAVVLKSDHEQFRITVLDCQLGKVRAIFFGTVSPGMVIRVQINTKTHMPHLTLLEIMAAPMALARSDIWWFHMMLALIDLSVPLGSGVGSLYEQLVWLSYEDMPLDKQLQMRYCAKIMTTLGLQRMVDQLCTVCMHALQVTSVDKLESLPLDSECSSRLAQWVAGSLEQHIGSPLVAYMHTKNYSDYAHEDKATSDK
jgi:hypothetical protein